jgi:hypothetical protein
MANNSGYVRSDQEREDEEDKCEYARGACDELHGIRAQLAAPGIDQDEHCGQQAIAEKEPPVKA